MTTKKDTVMHRTTRADIVWYGYNTPKIGLYHGALGYLHLRSYIDFIIKTHAYTLTARMDGYMAQRTIKRELTDHQLKMQCSRFIKDVKKMISEKG